MPLFGCNFVGFFAVGLLAMATKSALFRSKITYILSHQLILNSFLPKITRLIFYPQKETEIKHNAITVILKPVSFHNS